MSALEAAQRILDRHREYWNGSGHYCAECEQLIRIREEGEPNWCPEHADAGVVVERIREAEKHLQAIYDEIGRTRSRWHVIQDHTVAALSALVGDTHE